MTRVSICIATLDEEATIEAIVQAVAVHADEVLVVDGHSADRTRQLAEQAGAKVLLDHGLGKGDAIRTAIEKASGTLLVFFDADGSHNADDIPRLLAPLKADEADMVLGSRTRGGSDELHGDFAKFARMIGSDIITLAINYRFDVRLSDSQNGLRAMTAACARDLDLEEDITTIEQEMVMKALWRGYRIIEVPTHENRRTHGESRIHLGRVAGRYVLSAVRGLLSPGLPNGKDQPNEWGTVEQRD